MKKFLLAIFAPAIVTLVVGGPFFALGLQGIGSIAWLIGLFVFYGALAGYGKPDTLQGMYDKAKAEKDIKTMREIEAAWRQSK